MSTRLTPQMMKDPRAYARLQERPLRKASHGQLLQLAEWAIRSEDGPVAEKALQTLASRFKDDAQALYLHLLYRTYVGDPAETLIDIYKKHAAHASPSTASPKKEQRLALARSARFIAEQYMRLQQWDKAHAHLEKAFEHASTDPVPVVKCVQDVDKASEDPYLDRALAFDLHLFDLLFPWSGRPQNFAFGAVHVQGERLFVQETHHRLLFCFDLKARLLFGLREHDLAGSDFVHPEHIFELKDVAASSRQIYVAGSQDRIYVYTPEGEMERFIEAPEALRHPLSLACHDNGDLFVLYQNSARIHHFDTRGAYVGAFGENTTLATQQKSYFCGLATRTEDPHVYLYDRQRVQAFKPGENRPVHRWEPSATQLPPEQLCWNGLALTSDHQVIATDRGLLKGALQHPSPQEHSVPLSFAPLDVAADASGHLYVTDTHRIVRVDVNTNQVDPFLSLAMWIPQPTPENMKKKR